MNINKAYPVGEVTLKDRHIGFNCRFTGCSDSQPVVVVAGDEKTAREWHEKILIASTTRKHIWLIDGEWPDSGIPMFFKFSAAKNRPRPRIHPEEEAERGMGLY